MPACTSILEKLRQNRLGSYRHSPQDIEADFREEGQIQSDYHRRFVYELIQNADDALGGLDEDSQRRRLRFELRGDVLIVANNGRPIDEDDVCALCTMSYTTKSARDDRRASIGHKGKGFSSVLEITENPRVFSTAHSFEFDRQKSRHAIESLLEELDDPPQISGIPLMRLPFTPTSTPRRVEELFEAGFETIFWFPLAVEENDDLRATVARTLQAVNAHTIVFLRHIDALEICVDDDRIDWLVTRGPLPQEQTSEHQIVDVQKLHVDAPSKDSTDHHFALFTRRDIPIENHTVGISKNTWSDVKFTEVSIATVAEERDGEWVLMAFDTFPNIHVFLPTQERCPLPILINGAFHSTISRTRIEVDDDPSHYNGFLLSQVADLLASDVRDFAARAGDWRAFIGCLVMNTASTATLQTRLVEAVKESFSDVPFVPVADATQPVTVDEVLLPYYSASQPSIATTLCQLVGGQQIALPGHTTRRMLASTLLTEQHIQTLRSLGALQMRSVHVPAVLAELPAKHTKIRRSVAADELSQDPVVAVLFAARKTIEGDDELDKFDRTCCQHTLFPVGTPCAQGIVKRVAKGDDVFFFPPETNPPDIELSGLRFLCRELYRLGTSVSSQHQGNLVAELQPALKAIWDVRDFQFDEVLRAAVRPKISGDDTDGQDELCNTAVLRFLAALAENSTTRTQLLYRERRKRPLHFSLTQLPLPTRCGQWRPAYTLYFGDEWCDEDTPEARRVEPLAKAAGLDLDFLAPPEHFNVDDEDDLELLNQFLTWIGTSWHLRLRTLFSPAHDQRIKKTIGLKAPKSTHLAELGSRERNTYLDHLKRELADNDQKKKSYLYKIHALDQADQLMAAASSDLEVGSLLLAHLSAWWSDFYGKYTRAVLGTTNRGSPGMRTSSVFYNHEQRRLGVDLWLWRLRRTPWCPTSLGNERPENSWLNHPDLLRRFALDSTNASSALVPVVSADVGAGLSRALGVRAHLSSKTFGLRDAKIVCDSLERIYREVPSQQRATDLSRIRPRYRCISELLPSAAPDPSAKSLPQVPILCRTDSEGLAFVPSRQAFFVTSPDVRERINVSGASIFILESNEAKNFARHFGVHDLDESLRAEVAYDAPLIDATTALQRRLREAAPFILCRLEVDRRSSVLRAADATNLRNFIDEVTVVEDLSVRYSPKEGLDLPPIELGGPTRPGFAVDAPAKSTSRRRLPLIDHRAAADGGIDEALACVICEFMNVRHFEGIFTLLSTATTSHDRKRLLRLAGAPCEDEDLRSKERELLGKQDHRHQLIDIEIQPPTTAWEPRADKKTTPDAADTTRTQRCTYSLIDPDTLSFEDGQIVESRPLDASRNRSRQTSRPRREPNISGRLNTVGPSQEYIDDVDHTGTILAMRYEVMRLKRDYDCSEPAEYIFNIHNPERVREARESPIAGPCLEQLQECGVGLPYPGFDLLTVCPETDRIDRLIELKSSGLAIRKVAVTWNEWKTARNQEIRQHYYLYVVGGLRAASSGEPFLREIQNPFEILQKREHTERAHTQRKIQLDLRYFTAEADPVKESILRQHDKQALASDAQLEI